MEYLCIFLNKLIEVLTARGTHSGHSFVWLLIASNLFITKSSEVSQLIRFQVRTWHKRDGLFAVLNFICRFCCRLDRVSPLSYRFATVLSFVGRLRGNQTLGLWAISSLTFFLFTKSHQRPELFCPRKLLPLFTSFEARRRRKIAALQLNSNLSPVAKFALSLRYEVPRFAF